MMLQIKLEKFKFLFLLVCACSCFFCLADDNKSEKAANKVAVAPIVISILGKEQLERYFYMDFAFEAKDPESAACLKKASKKLRNFVFMDLCDYLQFVWAYNKQVDLQLLKKRLNYIIKELEQAGFTGIKSILINDVGVSTEKQLMP